ncbi:MAG: hypothetical protein K9J21_08995 [Bacteroidales bacterium]|nr:hypothetical protein [Bacteroidales bacterium]
MEINNRKYGKYLMRLFFLVSFTALLTQVIFMRQSLLLFEQSEYVVSVFLFFWLAANGLGLYLGGRRKTGEHFFLRSIQGYALVILLFYYGLHFIRPLLLRMKTAETLTAGFVLTVVCIVLPSFYNGWLFSQFSIFRQGQKPVLGLYKTEALAFFLAGAASTAVVYFFSDFYLLAAGLVLIHGFILMRNPDVKKVLLALLLPLMLLVYPRVQETSWQFLFPGHELISSEQTFSGQVDILSPEKKNDRLLLFQGAPVNTTKPPAAPEESSFPAIAQSETDNPQVLIAGSDILSLLKGFSYTQIRDIDILINDPLYFEKIRKAFPPPVKKMLKHDNLNIVHSSIQNHLRNHTHQYDLIYLSEHKPSLMENALLYFPQNIRIMKSGLTGSGTLSLLFSAEAAYTGQISRSLKGSVFNSMNNIFPSTSIFALDNYTVLLGSRDTLQKSFETMNRRLQQKGIQSMYFSSVNVGNRMQNQKAIGVKKIEAYTDELSFNKPVTYLAGLLKMIENYSVNTANSLMTFTQNVYSRSLYWQSGVLIVLTALFYFFVRHSPRTGIVFHAGFTGIAAQMMFIYLYQLHFGNIYLLIGMLVALFMVGLVAGLLVSPGKKFYYLPFLTLLVVILLIVTLFLIRSRAIAFIGMFMSGFYTGITFVVNNSIKSKEPVSGLKLYISDLFGGLVGNLVIPVLLIPLLGFYMPLFLFLTTGLITIWFQRKSLA